MVCDLSKTRRVPACRESEINLEQAKLNLDYTTITARSMAWSAIGRSRKGQFVQPGTNLLTIVPMEIHLSRRQL